MAALREWVCRGCGLPRSTPGDSQHLCPECLARQQGGRTGIQPQSYGYRLVAAVADYRLLIELAASLLRQGESKAALRVLDMAQGSDRGRQRFSPFQMAELARLQRALDEGRLDDVR